MNRAIVLGGGGPVVGFHVGAITEMVKAGLEPNIWACASVGAFVGCIYNSLDGTPEERIAKTLQLIKDEAFLPDEEYEAFPVPRIFTPNFFAASRTMLDYLATPQNYRHLYSYRALRDAMFSGLRLAGTAKSTDEQWNSWLMQLVSAHPFSRLMTNLVLQGGSVGGLTERHFESGRLAKLIDFEALHRSPNFVYFSAWNLDTGKLCQFANRHDSPGFSRITPQSLEAAVALPFLKTAVEIGGQHYCEGAMVSVLNFHGLLGQDLDEVWVLRLIDLDQIRRPRNNKEALELLIMLTVGASGEKDFELFKAQRNGRTKIAQLVASSDMNYSWTYSNLNRGIERGRSEARNAIEYLNLKQPEMAQ